MSLLNGGTETELYLTIGQLTLCPFSQYLGPIRGRAMGNQVIMESDVISIVYEVLRPLFFTHFRRIGSSSSPPDDYGHEILKVLYGIALAT